MGTAQVRAKIGRVIAKEFKKHDQALKKAKETQKKLRAQDRALHARGKGATPAAVKKLDQRIGSLRKKIESHEKQLVSAEQQYSKVKGRRKGAGKWLVGLSDADMAKLGKLSASYKAFERHMAKGLDAGAPKGEGCAWNACWTCSEACGGCTGCGQACSDINNCIARKD